MNTIARPARDAVADTASDAALREAIAQARRWYWQRSSAMVLGLCVVVHLAIMIVAVRGGEAPQVSARSQLIGVLLRVRDPHDHVDEVHQAVHLDAVPWLDRIHVRQVEIPAVAGARERWR